MWALNNDPPFAAERTLVCDRYGAAQWVVAIKCTYEFDSRGPRPCEEQEPVRSAPVHAGDPLRSSLLFECDLDYTRTTTDILYEGHAYAPQGPAKRVDVLLRVGPVTKQLAVHGVRFWKKGIVSPTASRPEPFVRMPLDYEHTFGGVDVDSKGIVHGLDVRNPAGRGFSTSAGRAIGKALPNIEYPQVPAQSWSDRPPPAGFGPIARHWSPRRELAGTYDAVWERDRMPLLPADFDERFLQCAPIDQQSPEFLRGGEPVLLRNLTPDGEWRFDIPAESFVLRTKMNGKWIEHRPMIHAVTIRGDSRTIVVLWKSVLPCHPHRLTLAGTTIQHKPRVRIGTLVAA